VLGGLQRDIGHSGQDEVCIRDADQIMSEIHLAGELDDVAACLARWADARTHRYQLGPY
jgi:hypothetical protein